jgi:enoyl-CoA hydratase/carnithine racemase
MIYRGKRMEAAALAAAGVASGVVASTRLDAEALSLAQDLAALPPATVTRAKRALIEPQRDALKRAMERESEACLAGASDPETLARLRSALK